MGGWWSAIAGEILRGSRQGSSRQWLTTVWTQMELSFWLWGGFSSWLVGGDVLEITDVAMKMDEKTLFLLLFLYFFLAETGSGSKNAGLETESGYADTRKRTNTDGEPEN
jgi:hypothetical protein